MTGNDTVRYYEHRVEQARSFAERARSPAARAIHLDLASRYARWLRHASRDRPLLTVIDGGRRDMTIGGGVRLTR